MGRHTLQGQKMNWNEFVEICQHTPEPKPVFFRLYHDEQGVPLFYSMEHLPGTYIELTQEQYAQGKSNIRVRDGKILELTWKTTARLEPTETGTPCDPGDVAIVVDPTQPHQCWSKKTYETN